MATIRARLDNLEKRLQPGKRLYFALDDPRDPDRVTVSIGGEKMDMSQAEFTAWADALDKKRPDSLIFHITRDAEPAQTTA